LRVFLVPLFPLVFRCTPYHAPPPVSRAQLFALRISLAHFPCSPIPPSCFNAISGFFYATPEPVSGFFKTVCSLTPFDELWWWVIFMLRQFFLPLPEHLFCISGCPASFDCKDSTHSDFPCNPINMVGAQSLPASPPFPLYSPDFEVMKVETALSRQFTRALFAPCLLLVSAPCDVSAMNYWASLFRPFLTD